MGVGGVSLLSEQWHIQTSAFHENVTIFEKVTGPRNLKVETRVRGVWSPLLLWKWKRISFVFLLLLVLDYCPCTISLLVVIRPFPVASPVSFVIVLERWVAVQQGSGDAALGFTSDERQWDESSLWMRLLRPWLRSFYTKFLANIVFNAELCKCCFASSNKHMIKTL